MSSILPKWPPACSQPQLDAILTQATDYALSHGLVLRPNPPNLTHAIHGPFALFPTPFPRALFEQVQALQPAYNDLYANLASDENFLDQVIGQTVAKVDDFQRGLWQIWKTVSEEGIAQPLALGLFRSDYLLHALAGEMHIKQVEFNTIAASFGPLASRVTDLHRYLALSGQYEGLSDKLQLDNLPLNEADKRLAAGLAHAHKAYGSEKAVVLMVAQDPERNAFDQRILEWILLEQHGVRLIRRSFSQLVQDAQLSKDKTLHLKELEISVVYFRAGYTPRDYPTEQEWATRLLLERSKAIKCPSVALQLAGAKKVQQVLATQPDLLKSHLSPRFHSQIDALRETFMGMWPMDSSEAGVKGQELARTEPERFVLKPQREGGGNNIYKAKIPPALREMEERDKAKAANEPREREGYILMELIKPPTGLENVLVRGGEGTGKQAEVVSELGIYGVALFKRRQGGQGAEVLVNETAGHLLRTKGSDDDEGGVAVGFSVIDSPLLV